MSASRTPVKSPVFDARRPGASPTAPSSTRRPSPHHGAGGGGAGVKKTSVIRSHSRFGAHLTRQTFALEGDPVQKGQFSVIDGVHEIFRLLDSDGSGSVSRAEFKAMFPGAEDEEGVLDILHMVDQDENGMVAYAQFIAFFRRLINGLIAALDSDGNGFLTSKEIEVVSRKFRPRWTPSEHRLFIRSVDRDHDGTVDSREFLNLVVVECIKELEGGSHTAILGLFSLAHEHNVWDTQGKNKGIGWTDYVPLIERAEEPSAPVIKAPIATADDRDDAMRKRLADLEKQLLEAKGRERRLVADQARLSKENELLRSGVGTLSGNLSDIKPKADEDPTKAALRRELREYGESVLTLKEHAASGDTDREGSGSSPARRVRSHRLADETRRLKDGLKELEARLQKQKEKAIAELKTFKAQLGEDQSALLTAVKISPLLSPALRSRLEGTHILPLSLPDDDGNKKLSGKEKERDVVLRIRSIEAENARLRQELSGMAAREADAANALRKVAADSVMRESQLGSDISLLKKELQLLRQTMSDVGDAASRGSAGAAVASCPGVAEAMDAHAVMLQDEESGRLKEDILAFASIVDGFRQERLDRQKEITDRVSKLMSDLGMSDELASWLSSEAERETAESPDTGNQASN